jgi:DNA-directed RNA polymerase subunit RPC12/RpoP
MKCYCCGYRHDCVEYYDCLLCPICLRVVKQIKEKIIEEFKREPKYLCLNCGTEYFIEYSTDFVCPCKAHTYLKEVKDVH